MNLLKKNYICKKKLITSSKSDQKKQNIQIRELFYNISALIVFNDDVNDFEYVIKCLVEICKLPIDVAIAKTYYIHHNDMDIVNEGEYEEMKQQKEALIKRGLKATVQTAGSN